MTVGKVARPRTRLRGLLVVLVVLGFTAVGVNLSFWRRRARTPSALRPSPSALRPSPSALRPLPQPEARQLERRLAQHPGDVPTRLALARLYFVARNFPQAIVHLSVLKTQNPQDAQVHLRLAMAQKYAGQLDEALQNAKRALQLNPQSQAAQEWLGEVYLAQGRSEEALDAFERVLRQHPNSYSAFIGKSRSLEQLYVAQRPVKMQAIVEPLEKAVQVEPQNPEGVLLLARAVSTYLGQLKRGEQLAREAMRLDPQNAEPYLVLSEIYLRAPTPAHLDEALTSARQAVALRPNDADALYLLARVQLRKQQVKEAIASLERAMQIRSTPEMVYLLSLAYKRAGERQKAETYSAVYQRWNLFMEKRKVLLGELQHRPRDITIYCRLAELYLSTGDLEPAENWLRKAQHLQKDHPRLRTLWAQLEKQKREPKKHPVERTNLQ